ncbi:MAG: PepSY-associated TM helix domain-containing protein [Pseudonocardiales bacterium]
MTTTSDPAASPSPQMIESFAPLRDPQNGSPPARGSTWALLRPVMLRVHFFAGVLVAPFLAVLCLTGLAYVFTPQLNDVVYQDELIVDQPGGSARPLVDQVAAALAATPGATLSAVEPATAPDRTTKVALSLPELPEGATQAVYVNPYTTEVQGSLTFVHSEPPLQATLRNLHGDLLLGDVGRLYSEFAASWLPVLVFGGLALWWTQRRSKRRARALLLPPTHARPGRGRIRGWHGSVGVWLTVALLFISVTGLTWSQYAGSRFETIITALDGRSAKLAAEPVEAAGQPVSVDQALASARAAGLSEPVKITAPATPGAPYKVAESSKSWPIQRDQVAVHPYTGQVSEQVSWSDNAPLAKLTTIGIMAHTGTLFGLFNQFALAAMALGLLAMLFWGYRMWWLRRPTRATAATAAIGAPAPRGGLRTLPIPVLLVIVVVTAAVGWLIPILGISLLLFLAADQVWTRIKRSRLSAQSSSAEEQAPPMEDPALSSQR